MRSNQKKISKSAVIKKSQPSQKSIITRIFHIGKLLAAVIRADFITKQKKKRQKVRNRDADGEIKMFNSKRNLIFSASNFPNA
ncbi:MAG TPA: hypothetical protein VK400_18295, partial [Pyrinomonadaceae bacterium]|nr:hypothetical protein [Pyrinomonadaceae bacterium]